MKGLFRKFVSHNYSRLKTLLCFSNSLIFAGFTDEDTFNEVITKMLEEDEKEGKYSLYSEIELEFFITKKFNDLKRNQRSKEYKEKRILKDLFSTNQINNNALSKEQ